ncbi:integrase, catalytic region, zinc finger, CCHC-type containing protein [Tanacetum coccineum]
MKHKINGTKIKTMKNFLLKETCRHPKIYQQSIANAGYENRAPMLERGSTIPRLQDEEDLQGDDLLYYDAKMERRNMILLSIPMRFTIRDSCKTARIYARVKRLMRDLYKTKLTEETRFTNELINLLLEPGESLFQGEFVEGMNATNETANVQRIVRTPTPAIRQRDEARCTIDDDQINSNIQFDSIKGNVNSGSVEKDTHVYDQCALETLARNAYDEAAKQQRFAQKVQQQNMTLTDQIEMYKERNRVLENITKDNNYLKEFLEADERAKRVQKQAESQLYRDRDIIRDLEKQRDKLSQEVKHFKQKNEELQQSHLILKRKMSENEDKYHDTILDLEEKLKKNVDLFLKIGNSLQAMFMLGPKPLSVYDQQLKHGLGYPNPYTLRQAISECPKLYVASRTGNIEIPLNVRDSEETLEDAFKSQKKNLFQRDIKEMKDTFEQNDVYLDEIERQNDLLKDQLLKVSLKHDIELCVLLDHECVDKSLHDELEQNLLDTISELKARMKNGENGMNATSSVKRPKSRDSHVKTSVLDVSKNEAKKEAVYVSEKATPIRRTLDTTSVASKSKIDEASASKARDKVSSLGHNLFSVGQFCDGDLEVAFRSNTCYVRNLEGDDLLTGGRDSNLYTISISDMAASSPICLMSKATSTKSWLWHRRLSHLNFGTINDLTKLDLVDGLPKFKYEKDHLCSACERGKSKKASHPPKLIPSDYSKLELLHMDLCGPMRVASVNGKKYILVIVDDFSRFTWVYFLCSKDETPEIIKKFIAQAQLNYKAKVCKIRTDNGTEFKNATLKAYYEKLGVMQQFSIARTPQQNGVV